VSDYASKISEFNKRIADIGAKLASLADRRKEYAFAAATGDTRALKQISDVDFEETSLVREQQTLNSAVETATALERQHAAEAQAAQEHARQVEAHKCASAVAALNCELDQMLLQLRECFERRAVVLRSLGNVGVVDPNVVLKLSSKSGPTAAAHAAGLGRFIHIDMVPVTAQRGLSDTNSLLLTIGEPPSKPNGKGNGNGSRRQ
jgi:hypothetical protein